MIVPPSSITSSQGCIDFLSYSSSLDGWIAGGWIDLGWDDQDAAPNCLLEFSDARVEGGATVCIFPRPDVRKIGTGILIFVEGKSERRDSFQDLILTRDGQHFRLTPSEPLEQPSEAEAITRTKSLLAGALRSSRRATFLRLMNRPTYAGFDTLEAVQPPLFLEMDSVCLCPPGGLLLRGWFIDPFKSIASIRVRCGAQSRLLDTKHWIPIPRPDVREGFSRQFGGLTDQCGFLAFVPDVYTPGETVYFELQTKSGDAAFKRIPQVRSPGIDTIKETLSNLELRYEELAQGYDHVLGPAIGAMNDFRMMDRVGYKEMVFGPVLDAPRCSIIVPLYGRIDFMELQLAFFSRTLEPGHEIIYVLDDPTKTRAAEALATSCLARFRMPFRLVELSANVGYAPANNIGLAVARGQYVCFLNSDVFPKTPDWLESMLETAMTRPDVGVVGALLVFEDETIQHEGCSYEVLPEFAGWSFSLHPRKGRFPNDDSSVQEVEAVTGACLMMPMQLAREVGGFDEGYVIGDFEDVDLCRKAQERGLICVVDRRARLYHLERQSQGGQSNSWRLNLTLYNAWRFQKRWVTSASELTASDPAPHALADSAA
ncbi:glycosyltransferase family 2 protein [Lichenicola sp.]|uniref:glycosyltransferase family 2 protein n=1 Tax=Lichenicola sp. TaxID=2804529 RepID=UPI003AFF801B